MCRQRNTTSVTIDTANCSQTGNSQENEMESGALLGERSNSRNSGGFLNAG